MDLGVAQGSLVGDLLEVLFQHVLEHPEHNQPQQLLSMANSYIQQGNIPKRKPVE